MFTLEHCMEVDRMPIADPPIKLASKKCGTLLHFRMVAVKFTPQIMLLSSHVKSHTKPHCSWLPRLMAFMRDRVRKNTVAGCTDPLQVLIRTLNKNKIGQANVIYRS